MTASQPSPTEWTLQDQAITALEQTIQLALALGVTREQIHVLTENTAAEHAAQTRSA